MRIEIASRMRPYSHVPGTAALIPGSSWSVKGYPTRLEFTNLITQKRLELDFCLTGLMENFTLVQDLEKRAVLLFGTAKEGYVRLMITHKENQLVIMTKRVPEGGLTIKGKKLGPRESLQIKVDEQGYLPPYVERISFGCHKAQDIELMHRRMEMDEILPFWFCLGQLTPPTPCSHEEGTLTLLKPIIECEKTEILKHFEKVFAAGFSDLFVPRLIDDQHQGVAPEIDVVSADLSPLTLLTEGAQLIRMMFFQQKGNELSILPCLHPDLHSGRLINGHAQNLLLFEMEWSKKRVQKLILRPLESGKVKLHLPNKIKSFRIRKSIKSRGEIHKADEMLDIEKGQPLFLDHFE
ncbi:MAG: hypothetical protein KDK50_00500 [Chlamydiia bacterium]|nr:hypothetical protein [Chlamydiia bacterium]